MIEKIGLGIVLGLGITPNTPPTPVPAELTTVMVLDNQQQRTVNISSFILDKSDGNIEFTPITTDETGTDNSLLPILAVGVMAGIGGKGLFDFIKNRRNRKTK